MANGTYECKEVRFVVDKHLTHCYVYLSADANCPREVQGWHHEVFNSSITLEDILKSAVPNAVMWPHKSPNNDSRL